MVDIVLSQNQAANGNSTNLVSSTLTTDFNETPYFDDYDPRSQYYRILYKPGYAVQSRELTQMQSMLQSQINRFGKHVFKEGSIVLPGSFTIRAATNGTLDKGPGNPVDYVKVSTFDTNNDAIDIQQFMNQTMKGNTSNISAYVIDVLPSDGTTQNTNTLYITYLSASSSNSSIRKFQEGETLVSNNGTLVVLTSANTSNVTGKASWFQIEEGVFFAKDHFIYFPTQSVVLDRYNSLPSCLVGFIVTEEIVDYTRDSSLLDPALESSNYSAPGADRLKFNPLLQVVPFSFISTTEDFVPLLTIKDGIIQSIGEKSQYSILGDAMASRTYDESGDYVKSGMNVQVSEHLKVTSPFFNYGKYSLSGNPSGNSNLLVAIVDPGVSYVKGYGVSKYDRTDVDFSKPTEYNEVQEQLAAAVMGQYVEVDEFVGTWELNKGNRVQLYDVPQRRISNGNISSGQKWSTGAQSGNNIGSAIFNSLSYIEGIPGYNAKYRIYLSDIKMTGSNSFSNVASLYTQTTPHASSGADISGIPITANSTNSTFLYETSKSTLLYYVGSDWTKTLKDNLGNSEFIYFFNKTEGVASPISISSGGILAPVLSLSVNQSLPYGNTTLSDPLVLSDFVVTMGQSFNIGPLWWSSVSANGNVITSANTQFTHLNVGDKIEISGETDTWYITKINSDTEIIVSNTVPASVTSNFIFKAYKTGDILDISGKGVDSGAQRTVTTTSTSFSIDIKETLPSAVSATVSYKVGTVQTPSAQKVLKPNRLVKIDCSTAGIKGPFCLGFSDVYSINKIVKKNGSAPSSINDGEDVTKFFTLDNGQRDTYYELANIIKTNAITLTSSDHLLISLNYFEPNFTGAGAFFTIDSYDINDAGNTSSSQIRTENIPVYISSSSGLRYDLRNHIDFRPVKTITATDTTTAASASTNPSSSSLSYVSGTLSAINFPVPDSQLVYSYSYYLGRIDVVCVNKEGSISVIKGTPAVYPVTPIPPDNQMIIAIINVTPYPSISPAYGNVIKRSDLSCKIKKASNRVYTMRDIGVLDKRISNLEYYTSLTLLEKNAVSLKILDENGLDRFKNGIFVDTFRDKSLTSAGFDPDFRIVNDPEELSIRPLFTTESIGYDFISGSGVTVSEGEPEWGVAGGIIMMNYTEVLQYNQPRVTETRLLERGTFFFQGLMNIIPRQDVWIDVTQLPDEIVDISADGALLDISVSTDDFDQQASLTKELINTEWGNWVANVTGYNLYRGEGAARQFIGYFSNREAALQAASAWTSVRGGGVATLETLYNNSRSGTAYFANFSSDQAAGTNKLISSQSISYIRPQVLAINCNNLKAFAKMNVFFDGVNISEYCTPLSYDQYLDHVGGKSIRANDDGSYPDEGDDLIVDQFRSLYFLFRIPSESGAPRFRCGQRKLVVIDNINIDVNTLDLTEDTSTTATAIFFAEGTAQTLQRTVYTTQGYLETSSPVSEAYASQTSNILPNTWRPPPKSHCCFDPDAKVLMADCTWKAIKDIMEGEEVIGDNDTVNTVKENNKVKVSDRKMVKLKDTSFYTTDDHMFLTKKGWKTWRPDIILRNAEEPNEGIISLNSQFLIGENRYKPINNDDELKKVKIIDGKIVEHFVPYEVVEGQFYQFDPDYIVHDLVVDGNMTYIVDGYVVHNCCVAYTVLIRAPDEEEGIFCTGFDFYVARKSTTRGIWAELAVVDESGQITNQKIPGTEVVFNNAEVPESPDGITNPVQIRFDSPVFLFNKTTYAFIVHSDSPDPFFVDQETQIWVSRLGQQDVNTRTQVNDRQGTGQFWQTTNNNNWSEVPDVDLKIEIYRADFTPSTTSFIIGQKPIEKMHISGQSLSFKNHIGKYFRSGDTLSLTNISGTISEGDRITGNVSTVNANSTIVSVIDSSTFAMAGSKYVNGEGVVIYNSGGSVVATANVANISFSEASLSYVDESQSKIYTEWKSSTGGFVANQQLTLVGNNGDNYKANIDFISDFKYSTVSLHPKVLDFVKTNIQYEMDTYDLGETTSSGYETINSEDITYFTEEKQIYSRSNELENISGDRSNKIRVTFTTTSRYVSPVLDLNNTQTIAIGNLINANTYGEGLVYDGTGNTLPGFSSNTTSSGGLALNRYISQIVTLDEDQEAEDLRVVLSAYRPPGTDVHVYAKLKNNQDSDPIKSKNWIRLEKLNQGDSAYSSLANRNNFREYTYSLPSDLMTAPSGGVQYINSAGTQFTSFRYYTIKIVLTAENPAVVPRVSELRVIALQM